MKLSLRHLSRALAIACVPVALPLLGACTASVDTGTSDDELTVCAKSSTVEGVDVSYYQGSIDWASVKASGRRFAIARVSDGTGFVDPDFAKNWAGIKAVGMYRGVYQFFRPGQSAVDQANLLIQRVGALGARDLPPVLDVEVTDGYSYAHVAQGVESWAARIKAHYGVEPLIYSSPGFWAGIPNKSAFSNDRLWVAHWGVACPSVPSPWGTWKLWQYADNGHVPGIAGLVDLDRFDGDLSALAAFANAAPPAPPPPPAPPTTCGRVDGGHGLGPGKSVSSCDGRFTLVMQTDGNLVLYRNGVGALWSTRTNGQDGHDAIMQGDGNFVLYDSSGQTPSDALWASGTAGHAGAWLAIQDDGNLVVYQGSKPLWDSHTCCH